MDKSRNFIDTSWRCLERIGISVPSFPALTNFVDYLIPIDNQLQRSAKRTASEPALSNPSLTTREKCKSYEIWHLKSDSKPERKRLNRFPH